MIILPEITLVTPQQVMRRLPVIARVANVKLTSECPQAAVYILKKESSFRVFMKNPKSSSHGLNGFLTKTWDNLESRYNIKRGLDLDTQLHGLLLYCRDRYGSVSKAARAHKKKGWY